MVGILLNPFELPFMQRALVEMLLLGVVGGVAGVYVVLRRLAFVGEALTHTVFPGVVVAALLGQSLAAGALVAGVLTAVLFTLLSARGRVPEDAVLAILLTSFFSVGVVLVSREHSYTSDLTAYLFGRVLFVNAAQLVQTAVVAVLVLATLAAVHKELVLRAFDPVAAAAAGYRLVRLDLLLNVVLVLVVVAAVRAVGTVLVLALLVVPAAAARLLTDRLAAVVGLSVLIGMIGGYAGLVVSYDASVSHGLRLASGATVVGALIVLYVAALAVRAARRLTLLQRDPEPAGRREQVPA